MFGFLLTVVAIAANYHAMLVLDVARGQPAYLLRRWAERSALQGVAFLVLYAVVVVHQVQHATSPIGAVDPAERVANLASYRAAAINCGPCCGLASVLPLGAALWLLFKAKRVRARERPPA